MMRKFFLSTMVLVLLALPTCQVQKLRLKQQYRQLNELVHREAQKDSIPFIKCHLQNGGVVVFQKNWHLDTAAAEISGQGRYFDFNRERLKEGFLRVGMDSVALYEANRLEPGLESRRLAGLMILSSLNIAGTIFCAHNPKACFGSCPTFYTGPGKSVHEAAAEGFSRAIFPSLAYADVDDLDTVTTGKSFSLYMKNEALETHVVRDAALLALPCKKEEQIYQSPQDDFYAGSRPQAPSKALSAEEGSILQAIRAVDDKAYFSPADGHNLYSPEELLLELPLPAESGDSLGLVLDFRQSLMTTYFIYSALSYMGPEASDYLSQREIANQKQALGRLAILKKLGGIEVSVYKAREESWKKLGNFYETGPIAINRQVLPFAQEDQKGPIRLKLRLNRGLWRINRVGLTRLHRVVKPEVVKPRAVRRAGVKAAKELRLLQDSTEQLISWPGQTRRLEYQLPTEAPAYALFLRSEGYYLEWMREQWLEDQDLLKLRQMMKNPEAYLREEAQPYKRYEEHMEEVFWSSQVKPNALSHYENP
ncbi:MAG: hypothetical protein RI842_10695 [Schleiferiaceae bacterium]|nr:hypothetical protein [Schleiferiaceae bacterium]